MAKNDIPWEVDKAVPDQPEEPPADRVRPKAVASWWPWGRGGKNPPGPIAEGNREREERRATSDGPQLCSLVVDHSASMEEGNKAEEATRVLREVIQYAHNVNSTDTTGKKVYFYTQIVFFAKELQDSTNGMSRPPVEFSPEEAFTVRHPKSRERLGNLTDFQLPLAHVYKTLTGKQGMTKVRLAAAMPAPIVLFITDGKPNLPVDEETARRLALQEADKLKVLALPAARRFHPVREEIQYDRTNVRLITVGLGNGAELDQRLLEQLCTHVRHRGEDLPLYLHCPEAKELHKIGARIIGTVTTAGQSSETLEDAIYALRHATGATGR